MSDETTTVDPAAVEWGGRTMRERDAERARDTILLPRHVRAAYRANELRDAFMDGSGRIWYAETHELRAQLPADPESYQKIPPQFWAPVSRRRHRREVHEAEKRAQEDQRAELEVIR